MRKRIKYLFLAAVFIVVVLQSVLHLGARQNLLNFLDISEENILYEYKVGEYQSFLVYLYRDKTKIGFLNTREVRQLPLVGSRYGASAHYYVDLENHGFYHNINGVNKSAFQLKNIGTLIMDDIFEKNIALRNNSLIVENGLLRLEYIYIAFDARNMKWQNNIPWDEIREVENGAGIKIMFYATRNELEAVGENIIDLKGI